MLRKTINFCYFREGASSLNSLEEPSGGGTKNDLPLIRPTPSQSTGGIEAVSWGLLSRITRKACGNQECIPSIGFKRGNFGEALQARFPTDPEHLADAFLLVAEMGGFADEERIGFSYDFQEGEDA